MTIPRSAQQVPEQYEVVTRVTAQGGVRVVVKITTEAIEGRGRAACIGMAAAKIRSFGGNLPPEVIVSASDFR